MKVFWIKSINCILIAGIIMGYQYYAVKRDNEIKANEGINLNKLVFSEFAKQNITILEMKKPETTLEDAFMKIITEGDVK